MTEEQYAAIQADLAANAKEHESYNRRLSEHDDAIRELSKTQLILERLSNAVNNLATTMTEVKSSVQRVDQRVAQLEQEPADKWKKMTWKVVELVLAAVVGAVIMYVSR